MDKKRLINLEYLSILELNGEGSFELLQGQITSDVSKVSPNRAVIGAICDVKGRVISSFTIITNSSNNGYFLIGDKDVMVETQKILSKYQPFYDVSLILNESFAFYGIHEDLLSEYYPQTDLKVSDQQYDSIRRVHILDKSYHLLIAENESSIERDNLLNSEDWFLDDINNKNFEISIKSIGMFTPHELGYHLSSRVDFEKGCYTGQEIVARMHYRAKKLPSLIIKTSANYQEEFSKIYDHTKTAIGTVLSCVEHGAIFHYLISMNKNFKEQEFEI